MEYKIEEVVSLGKGWIRARYKHGPLVDIDLNPLISKGNLFANLAEDEYLAAVEIMEDGYYLSWPGELDMGADTLWLRRKADTDVKPERLIS